MGFVFFKSALDLIIFCRCKTVLNNTNIGLAQNRLKNKQSSLILNRLRPFATPTQDPVFQAAGGGSASPCALLPGR